MNEESKLRLEIANRIKKIFNFRQQTKPKFSPGKTWIQYAGSVFDEKEINAVVGSLLNGWFGLGPESQKVEKTLANFLGVSGSILVNSGSSANLLAIATLRSPTLEHHLNRGDEVITLACGFPTTVNPLFQYGLIPVFVDVDPETYGFRCGLFDCQRAFSGRTRAILVTHTLGNPNSMGAIVSFCQKNNLILIEDNCDSLGSEYNGKKTGSFGLLSTQSFYPPHHITMGEGGAVNFNEPILEKTILSLRDWGRACWCRGDEKRTLGACQRRFNWELDGQPYDHKYIFNEIGYNLKPIEMMAAMGIEQLKKFPDFINKRQINFDRLFNYAKAWEKYFILPRSLPEANPCWFAFPLTIRDGVKFTRQSLVDFLEKRLIQTRPLFGGNLTKQPAYKDSIYRQVGNLKNSDRILHNAFFVGIYPGIGNQEIDYIAESINDFLKKYGD